MMHIDTHKPSAVLFSINNVNMSAMLPTHKIAQYLYQLGIHRHEIWLDIVCYCLNKTIEGTCTAPVLTVFYFVLAREHTSVVYHGFRNQDREGPVGSRINQVETFALWSS